MRGNWGVHHIIDLFLILMADTQWAEERECYEREEKGLKESKKAPQRSLKEKRKAKKEKKNVGLGGGS